MVTPLTIQFNKHYTFEVGVYNKASTDVFITNDNTDRTHQCIYCGPPINKKGPLNCLDVDTGMVVVRRLMKLVIWFSILFKKTNARNRKGNSTKTREKVKFLNQVGEMFDGDKDDLDKIDHLITWRCLVTLVLLLESLGFKPPGNTRPK